MNSNEKVADFTLLGGPLHRLGVRVGLVRNGTNTIPLGIAIGLFLWVVMMALALIGGVGEQAFTLDLIAGHVRLLLVIPLLFIGEAVVDPRMRDFARSLVRRGIVAGPQVAALDSIIVRTCRWKDSWLPEFAFLAIAVLMAFSGRLLEHSGNTASFVPGRAVEGGEWVAWWYGVICLTVFRFLFLRMLWRIAVWSYFLWRVALLELQLLPMHPDRVGGLGAVATVQTHFVAVIIGFSALRAAQFAEEISSGRMPFEGIYPGIAAALVLNAILFVAPLLVFSPKLWRARLKGLGDYMGLAATYVTQFDQKWVQSKAQGEPLLGTPDMQSLADLGNSVDVVREMRWMAVGPRMLTTMGMAVILPMFPLLLLKFPITEIARKLITGLVGL